MKINKILILLWMAIGRCFSSQSLVGENGNREKQIITNREQTRQGPLLFREGEEPFIGYIEPINQIQREMTMVAREEGKKRHAERDNHNHDHSEALTDDDNSAPVAGDDNSAPANPNNIPNNVHQQIQEHIKHNPLAFVQAAEEYRKTLQDKKIKSDDDKKELETLNKINFRDSSWLSKLDRNTIGLGLLAFLFGVGASLTLNKPKEIEKRIIE